MGAEILLPVEEDSTRRLRKRLEWARVVVQNNRDQIVDIEAELVRRQEPLSLEEALAELCHEQWCGWMDYLFGLCVKTDAGSVVIPSSFYSRWKRQAETPYSELSEQEQASGQKMARQFADVFSRWEASCDKPLRLDRSK